MFPRLSLRYRIALVIFLLECAMMAAVLRITLGESFSGSASLIRNNESAILSFVTEDSRVALITEEYLDYQIRLRGLLVSSDVAEFHLADAGGTVVASSDSSVLGRALPLLVEEGNTRWKLRSIDNAAGHLGAIALKFSDENLMRAYARARVLGVVVALSGMLIIAVLGVTAGFVLTQRLERITGVARRVAGGDLDARTNLKGKDEIAALGTTIDAMLRSLGDKELSLRQSLAELSRREQDLETTLNSIGDAVIATDEAGRVQRMNPIAETLTGWSFSEACGRPLGEVFPIVDTLTGEPIANPVETVLRTGEVLHLGNNTTLTDRAGLEHQISDSAAPLRGQDGNILGTVLVFKDVTEEYALRRKAKDAQEQLQGLVNNMRTLVAILDTDGRIQFVNQAPQGVAWLDTADLVHSKLWDIPGFVEDPAAQAALRDCVARGREGVRSARDLQFRIREEVRWISLDIHPLRDEQGAVSQLLLEGRDISERKAAEEKVFYQAHFDELTGLPNRFLALDRLAQLISEARREERVAAVLFIDLDDFKKVNDTLGHDTGDKLLVEAADRLRTSVRGSDTVGRLGGDEFIVLLGGLEQGSDAQPVAEHLLNRFRSSFLIDGRELTLTLSVGVAVFPGDGQNTSELLRKADAAMYHAKEQGRNSYSFFTGTMNEGVTRRLAIEEQMHGAIERGEFEVYYQPQLHIRSGEIAGSEALLRWRNPALGNVSPGEFIGIAEQTDSILPLGRYVLAQALAANARWRSELGRDLRISVNLSPRQFRDAELVSCIAAFMRERDLPGNSLELEITEGMLMGGNTSVALGLGELNALGVRLAMDDFGTGYSSMSNLRHYPFDVLKVDKSFVNDIARSDADRELVAATVAMAHAMDLKVVAEGVETREQLHILRELGCDFAQGYYFARPMPEAEMLAWLGEATADAMSQGPR